METVVEQGEISGAASVVRFVERKLKVDGIAHIGRVADGVDFDKRAGIIPGGELKPNALVIDPIGTLGSGVGFVKVSSAYVVEKSVGNVAHRRIEVEDSKVNCVAKFIVDASWNATGRNGKMDLTPRFQSIWQFQSEIAATLGWNGEILTNFGEAGFPDIAINKGIRVVFKGFETNFNRRWDIGKTLKINVVLGVWRSIEAIAVFRIGPPSFVLNIHAPKGIRLPNDVPTGRCGGTAVDDDLQVELTKNRGCGQQKHPNCCKPGVAKNFHAGIFGLCKFPVEYDLREIFIEWMFP